MDLHQAIKRFYYSEALCDLRLLNRKMVDQNITYHDLLYLELIYTMEGNCTASKLAELLYLSKPPVTARINDLIKKGLVNTIPDPRDHRQHLLSVNEDVIPKYRYHTRHDKDAIEAVKEEFSKEDIEKFCQMLNTISDNSFKEIT